MHAQIDNVIGGSGGGGKSGGSASSGKEYPNTLRSKAKARFVELLSEGEIVGLVDGARSIILNKIALENADNSKNYTGFSWKLLTGTSDQTYLEGYTSGASEQAVGLRVKASQPVVYRTQSASLDAIRVTLQIPALTKLDKKEGSLQGYNVTIAIDVKSLAGGIDNPWITRVQRDYISGKCTAPYERAYRIGVEGDGPWLVRMRRLSIDDDGDSTIQSSTVFAHVTEITDHKVAYSDSAVIGIEIDADQFGNGAPDREYDIFGIKMQYPSNYNPATRVYTGFWDGTWTYGYCNNPAWLFRWLAINPRFGAAIPDSLVDKWGLYELSKYCDALVSNGIGGQEPRFQFNGEIADQEDAYRVLQQIASMMRAIVFYSSGAVIVRQDAPMAPEQKIYTPANVIGKFTYSSTALSVRHNACVVSWTNPDIGYETDYEVYEDRKSILKYGYNQMEIKALGTTSRGQAYRMAKWAILTEQLQRDTVNFDVGFDSSRVLPGDIIEVADPHRATADFGGRLRQPDTTNGIKEGRFSFWTNNGVTRPGLYKPGPWGARNLIALQAQIGFGAHSTESVQTVALVQGKTYTYSFFASPGTTSLVYARVATTNFATINASFDLGRELVLAQSSGVVKAKVEKWDNDLYRCSITFVALESLAPNLTVGIDQPARTIVRAAGWTTWNATVADNAYFGCPQLEQTAEASYPMPPQPNGTTLVMLDRDIEYTGATTPELHLTLVDGPLDDKAGMDNTGRLAGRKITYFSSPVTNYYPEIQSVLLSKAIPAAGNDKKTPLVWIFSKAQVAPAAYKVISVKENDTKSYAITAIEYNTNKFVQIDEGFVITYDTNRSFSNLPTTAFCEPPVGPLRVEPTSQLVNGSMQQSITVGWGPSPDKFLRGYVLSYKRNDDNWVTMPMIYENTVEIRDILNGGYVFVLRAVNKFGVASEELTQGVNLNENTVAGRGVIVNMYTDTGGITFSDKDLRVFWISNSLSADPQTAAFRASVQKGAGAGTTSNSDGYLVTGGTQTESAAAVSVDISNVSAPTITTSGTWRFGDHVTVNIGLNEFVVEYANNDTVTGLTERLKTLIDADPRYIATRSGQVITVTFVDGATNATAMESTNDPLFKRYAVRVRDSLTNALKRTEYVTRPEYTYSYAKNAQDFGGVAQRSVKIELTVEDIFDNVSGTLSAIFTNPAPFPPPITVKATPFALHLKFTPPSDPDYQGIVVYMSETNGFIADEGSKVYQDRGNPAIPVEPEKTYYYKYGFYDAFGTQGIALSPQSSITTGTLGEMLDPRIGPMVDSVANQLITLGEQIGRVDFMRDVINQIGYVNGQPVNTAVIHEVTNRVKGDEALHNIFDAIIARNSEGTAYVLRSDLVLAGEGKTLAQSFQDIGVQNQGIYGTVQQLQEVLLTDDGITARAVLQTDVNGNIAGIQIGSSMNSTSIRFIAEEFGFADPNGGGQARFPLYYKDGILYLDNVFVNKYAPGSVTAGDIGVNQVTSKVRWVGALGSGDNMADFQYNNWVSFGWPGAKMAADTGTLPVNAQTAIRLYINAQRTGGDNDRIKFRLRKTNYASGAVTYLEEFTIGLSSAPGMISYEWNDRITLESSYNYAVEIMRVEGIGNYLNGKLLVDTGKR